MEVEVVLAEPEALVAQRLSPADLLEHPLVVALEVVPELRVAVSDDEQAEFQGSTPSFVSEFESLT